ncbi:uncharacterized protein LOC116847168 [Odontomachus brunneus]|uniref:uncharacterized protein LOC116847168 n=1 Tax=Odontomachus brunneus TaxID=486640 RepID=UPI0013F1CBAE|nr:uncharacterized protein LOC116847168 [Odontomachus brunneus]
MFGIPRIENTNNAYIMRNVNQITPGGEVYDCKMANGKAIWEQNNRYIGVRTFRRCSVAARHPRNNLGIVEYVDSSTILPLSAPSTPSEPGPNPQTPTQDEDILALRRRLHHRTGQIARMWW